MAYDDIPDSIKQYPQWINWHYELVRDKKTGIEKPTKVPLRPVDGFNASSTNPRDWTTFERAKTVALERNVGLGFVFTKSDPFIGFDLDDAEGNPDVIKRQSQIYQMLNSYSEWSPSGKGLHIIVEGKLPGKGRHPKHYGVFDNERFFCFTGNVLYGVSIRQCQDEAQSIYESLGSDDISISNAGYETQAYSDDQVCAMAAQAANGNKFSRLWSGDWQTDYGPASGVRDPSQSAADFALVNILGFYSRNLDQTIRLFRSSGLGQRDKAKRGNYVGTMARRAFDRLAPVITITPAQGAPWFDARTIEPWVAKVAAEPVDVTPWQEPPVATLDRQEPPRPALVVSYSPDDPGRPLDLDAPVPPMAIPGLVGELVAFCWNRSPEQIAEVSIAHALSFMSLLCSRSYCHGSLGLSLYLMVLAKTSLGKSFMFSANDRLYSEIKRHFKNLPPSMQHAAKDRLAHINGMIMIEPGSAQGLAHHLQSAPAVLMHADEYVETIRMMAQPNPPPHLAQMRSELLKLVEMAGPGRTYFARKYSTRGPSATEGVDVLSASLTMLACGVPQQFYDELTSTLLTSGFLPRFTILEYEGTLCAPNLCPQEFVPPDMFSRVMTLLDIAYNKSLTISENHNDFTNVQPGNPEAAARLDWFKNVSRRGVKEAHERGSNMEGLWSRSYANVCKIASLIAVGCNPHFPQIMAEHVDIAIRIVQPAIYKIQTKVTAGEMGVGDDRLEADLKHVIKRFLRGWDGVKGYPNVRRDLVEAGYFQVSTIRNICMKLNSFKSHRLGSSNAFENTLAALIKYGSLTISEIAPSRIKCVTPNMSHFD